jgi:hypothetical protein
MGGWSELRRVTGRQEEVGDTSSDHRRNHLFTNRLYGLTWLGDSASLSLLPLMVPPNRARWAFAASLLLTAAFAAGLAGEFVHTDDGCQVEVHCIACQRVLLSVSTGAMAPPWHPSIEPVGRVTSHDPIPTHVAETHASASRGPPLA